jgi:hypothetical protein
MDGPGILVASMSVPQPRGRSKAPWQYHSRSDLHSRVACWGVLFDLICRTLTARELPPTMPARERRKVDAIIEVSGYAPRIFEFDESQHFNIHRAATLRAYPDDVTTAFPRDLWLRASQDSTRKLGTTGGWGRARPPLLPHPGGRHLQRAFRDALADLLPAVHGWAPTDQLPPIAALLSAGPHEPTGRPVVNRCVGQCPANCGDGSKFQLARQDPNRLTVGSRGSHGPARRTRTPDGWAPWPAPTHAR